MGSLNKPVLHIAALIVVSALLLVLLGAGDAGSWSDSPVVQQTATKSPLLLPVASSGSPLSADPGAREPEADPPPRWLSPQFWSALPPWIAVGVVGFGGLALLLGALLRRFRPKS